VTDTPKILIIEDDRETLALLTPLSRLRLSLELARQEPTLYLDKADAQVEALAGLIDELAFFSRLEAAPYEANKAPVDIATLIRMQLDIFGSDRFESALEPATLALDRRLFERALGNVLRNALKYSPTDRRVAVRGTCAAGEYQIEIEDDGPGVEESERQRIFEPFYRTDAARARDTGGTGLGLAITKRCIDAHHGRVSAHAGTHGGLLVRISVRS